jgi:hypothetical protein
MLNNAYRMTMMMNNDKTNIMILMNIMYRHVTYTKFVYNNNNLEEVRLYNILELTSIIS